MKSAGSAGTPQTPSALAATAFWLKLGWISFGGPAGQIAIMHRELVERRRWISEARFLHALNYCMLLPGPEAQQLATYIGWLLHRTRGGLIAGGLFVLPSLLILIGLTWTYVAYGHLTLVSGLLYGIKPAVVAIIVHATFRIGRRTLRSVFLAAIAVSAFIAIHLLAVAFPAVVGSAALLGALAHRWRPGWLAAKSEATADGPDAQPAHARFRPPRALAALGVATLLWLLPMTGLTWHYGWNHDYTQMGWFFTKAALLTFGGAYAVLPYISQAAVAQYGWLSSGQMMDGLALGETTPGPLIMVVAFVGFMGGYPLGVDGSAFWAGALGALIVTWFSFLPSFTFIFVGAPLVESSGRHPAISASLAAITAAVVGVILNLAVYFGSQVFWPDEFDPVALMIATVGTLTLIWRPNATIPLILASALCGVLLRGW